ncbi:hypothetical protein [Albimonas pacifica]|uniref:Uncharacterized protein n=1 Tax=Albimonas pacifica TaxID=1114924 RepID=A0A1I3FVK2_9RHOB|nr:hypothetical protein [Albimonas pacifica]SFI15239.1 hypothetical protein SAMN05216258_104546 [Albimonas pacifica]
MTHHAPEGFFAYVERVPKPAAPSFAALVYAETGLTPEEAAQSSLYTATLIECWHRSQETPHG